MLNKHFINEQSVCKILTNRDEINDKYNFEKYESVRVSCFETQFGEKYSVSDG